MIPGIKEKILDTSYVMFRDRGYEQTTLRAIAEACGVTHANVLYHFRSKHDIASGIILQQKMKVGTFSVSTFILPAARFAKAGAFFYPFSSGTEGISSRCPLPPRPLPHRRR